MIWHVQSMFMTENTNEKSNEKSERIAKLILLRKQAVLWYILADRRGK